MKKPGLLTAGILLGLILGFFVRGTADKVSDKAVDNEFKNNYRIYAIPLPDSLDFAGEAVPLDKDYVRERLDKELLINVYWQSSGLLKIKRAAKYFPVIEPILNENGIPEDFKYLSVAESNLENTVSPAGAAGIWQLGKKTARNYGLIVNDQIDQRYDLILATQTACRYLQDARAQFGSWTLAAAAYNRGMNGLQAALDDQADSTYYTLFLNPETARYVYRIIANKMILSRPGDFGFHFRPSDLYAYPSLRSVAVDTAVTSWPAFARKFGLSYGELRYYNPFIRAYAWDNKDRDTIQVYLPE